MVGSGAGKGRQAGLTSYFRGQSAKLDKAPTAGDRGGSGAVGGPTLRARARSTNK